MIKSEWCETDEEVCDFLNENKIKKYQIIISRTHITKDFYVFYEETK